jgi:hypothetical protein
MHIKNFKLERIHGLVRCAALVKWEDCELPDKEVFIETEARFGEDIAPNPHSFLIGCLIPALHFGEKRIRLDGEVCPMLLEGLETAMAIIKEWTGGEYEPLHIEVPARRIPRGAKRPPRAASFLSGGMDSLAALRLNHRRYPEAHPGYIKDCFLIHGFDIGGVVERGMKYHVFERAKAAMASVAEDAAVTLIPVYTNLRHLCDERELWLEKFFGAVLAAVAHAFDVRLNLVFVPSSYDIPNLVPCGSHPLLDPEYSSYNLGIRHRDHALSRLEKLIIIAGWDAAFQNFRVCLANVKDRLNCGRCEKCVRTMIGLLAIDALHKTKAFVEDDVTPEMLSAFNIKIRHRPPFYRELLPLLRERGRDDLVKTIEKKLSE